VNDRRGEPDNHSIPRTDAWDRVAKLLFPAHELVKTFPRDRWLIDRYCPPNNPPNDIQLKNQPASLLPGGITYISGMVSQGRAGLAPVCQDSGKTFPPKKLIREVDEAYFRQSLREDVHRWFARRGFDRAHRTIPKHLLDAAVQADFGRLPPEPEKSIEKDAAKAKSCKPRPPRRPASQKPKKPKKTPRTRLISLMEEIGLEKGLLDFEAREKVRLPFKKKYPKLQLPAPSTINRAYEEYTNSTDTSAESSFSSFSFSSFDEFDEFDELDEPRNDFISDATHYHNFHATHGSRGDLTSASRDHR
jgi:hypothetical protein